MSSFEALKIYHPLIILAAGLLGYLGMLGIGFFVIKLFRLNLNSPWKEAVGIFLGIHANSLLVQGFAFAGASSRGILTGYFAVLMFVGMLCFVRLCRKIPRGGFLKSASAGLNKPAQTDIYTVFFIVLAVAAVFLNLCAALAPSTKHDEVFYHMLLPARILHDAGLKFYLFPYESAVLPQMIYQIALTPFHAVGLPDAGNVMSWALSLTLIGFGYLLIRQHGGGTLPALFWILLIPIGMHPIVWHVTGGSHAMGDLAFVVCLAAVLVKRELIRQMGIRSFVWVISVSALTLAASKISFSPIAVIFLMAAVWELHRSQTGPKQIVMNGLQLIFPWVIFLLPLLLWTFKESGSPWGPVGSGFFSGSLYKAGEMNTLFDLSRQLNRPDFGQIAVNILLYAAPFLWIFSVCFFFVKELKFSNRLLAGFVVFIQSLLIYIYLPYDVRFYGGLPYGLALAFLCYAPSDWLTLWKRFKMKTLVLAMLVLPWVGIQAVYVAPFAKVSLGLCDPRAFASEKIAFYDDYLRLNAILPHDSGIFAANFRLNAVYAPRPVFLDSRDLPKEKRLYLFWVGTKDPSAPEGYRLGQEIYRNETARTVLYRTLWREPLLSTLRVYEMIPTKVSEKTE